MSNETTLPQVVGSTIPWKTGGTGSMPAVEPGVGEVDRLILDHLKSRGWAAGRFRVACLGNERVELSLAALRQVACLGNEMVELSLPALRQMACLGDEMVELSLPALRQRRFH